MDYSQSEINSMRNDALRRTREMHSRANNENLNVQAEPSNNMQSSMGKQENNMCGSKKSDPLSGLFSGLFSDGKLDNDKIIIIILIIILAREGADLKLLLALGYIIM